MGKTVNFFRNIFLANGIIWFFNTIAILIFKFNFGPKEIMMSLVLSLSYATIKIFDFNNKKEIAVNAS